MREAGIAWLSAMLLSALFWLGLGILVFFSWPAHAERWCAHWYGVRIYDGWSYRIERRCARWVHRDYEPRVYAYERRYDEDDGWLRRDPELETGINCKEPVRVVGEAHLTEKGAIESAIRQWSATVRYDWGEKWMEIETARNYRWRCDRAGTNESTLGKIGEAITSGQGYQRRCMVIARPCMQAPKRGDRDDR